MSAVAGRTLDAAFATLKADDVGADINVARQAYPTRKWRRRRRWHALARSFADSLADDDPTSATTHLASVACALDVALRHWAQCFGWRCEIRRAVTVATHRAPRRAVCLRMDADCENAAGVTIMAAELGARVLVERLVSVVKQRHKTQPREVVAAQDGRDRARGAVTLHRGHSVCGRSCRPSAANAEACRVVAEVRRVEDDADSPRPAVTSPKSQQQDKRGANPPHRSQHAATRSVARCPARIPQVVQRGPNRETEFRTHIVV